MTTYYRDPDIHVTTSVVQVGNHQYDLDDLESVWHRRTRRFARASYVLATRIGTVVAVVTVSGVLVVGCVGSLVFSDIAHHLPFGQYALACAAVIATIVAVLAGFGLDPALELLDRSHEQGHGVCEIWARVDGQDVLLLRTVDATRFGRVYRAIQRAIEHHAYP